MILLMGLVYLVVVAVLIAAFVWALEGFFKIFSE